MPSVIDFLPMLLKQSLSDQSLERIPEPTQLTDATDNVVQYDRVMSTKLVIAYAAGLEVIHRAANDPSCSQALDLACGPGHFTLCLSRYLQCGHVTGIDLSGPMVDTARQNASQLARTDRVTFSVGDATKLNRFDSESIDLCCCTDAVHHLPNLSLVTEVLREMDRVTRPEGLVMVMDLVRLATPGVTEKYVRTLGHDYVARNLSNFFDDFRNSMYAAWTAVELRQAVPRESRRVWCHLVPRGLPTIQILLGLPAKRETPFVRPGWSVCEHPLVREWLPRWRQEVGESWARETLTELKLLKMTLAFGSKTLIRPLS